MSITACGLLKRMMPAETGFPRNVTLPETGQSFGPESPHPEKPKTTATSATIHPEYRSAPSRAPFSGRIAGSKVCRNRCAWRSLGCFQKAEIALPSLRLAKL